jgi:hypothetical protein
VTFRLLLHFTDYADPDWAYMYHCHMLRHEDHGMMGQFVVVRPGQEVDGASGAGMPGRHDDHDAMPAMPGHG